MTVRVAPETMPSFDVLASDLDEMAAIDSTSQLADFGGPTKLKVSSSPHRPASAPPTREDSASLSALQSMETFTPRVGKAALLDDDDEDKDESPTAVIADKNGKFGGLSPVSSLASSSSAASLAMAVATEAVVAKVNAEEAGSVPSAAPSSLPPYAEGSRFKILNRMGINIRPTNDMVLIQRTANVERNKPGNSGDDLACRIRDVKMPWRAAFFVAVHFGFKFNWWLYSKVAKAICPGGCNAFDARTRWFDEAVIGTLDVEGSKGGGDVVDTVVALAAGYDTRCLRLSRGRPGVKFIELDLPHVSKKKKKLVEKLWPEGKQGVVDSKSSKGEIEAADEIDVVDGSTCSSYSSSPSSSSSSSLRHPVFVASDMLDPERASRDLAAAGWKANAPCATTIEGLLYYLPLDKAEAALATVSATVAPGSTLAFDFWPQECVVSGGKGFPGYKRAALMVADLGEPFLTGFPHEPEEHARYASKFGFRVRELLNPEQIVQRYFPHKRHEPHKGKLAVTTFMYFALWEKI